VKFESTEQLKKEIAADGEFCQASLSIPEFAAFQKDPFLTPWEVQKPPAIFASQIVTSAPLKETLQSLPPLQPGFARLFLTRHGETDANEQGFLCGGDHESQLNAQGEKQAEELAQELLRSVDGFAVVGSSEQRRAMGSAELVAQRFPAARRVRVKELHEMKYGDLEGARIADVRSDMISLSQSWRQGSLQERVGGERGESPEDVIKRVLASVRQVLQGEIGQSVLLVCHSWVNKTLIASVTPGLGLHKLLDVPQRNCAVNVLDYSCGEDGEGEFRVLAVDLVAGSRARI